MRGTVLTAVLVLLPLSALARQAPMTLTQQDENRLGYFSNSYQQARTRFRESARMLQRAMPGVEISKIRVPDARDRDLTIDVCYVPPPGRSRAKRLLVISSGVHGVEGFVGSAVQQLFIKEVLPGLRGRQDLGVLLVHGVNPWGFKNKRRVSAGFVDLNRNFDVNGALFQTENAGYDKLKQLLNPEGKARYRSWGNPCFLAQVGWKLLRHGKSALRQAILGGQYKHEECLYFGGKAFEPQKPAVESLLRSKAADADAVFLVDVHTGYGKRGQLHLFGSPNLSQRNQTALRQVFGNHEVDTGGTGDFYTTTGDFTDYVAKLLPQKTVVPMCFEYGTVGMKLWHDLKSLQTMRLENQGYRFGYRSQGDRQKIETGLLEMYNPSSPGYRAQIMRTTADLLPEVVSRFAGMELGGR